jgi:uncharacterized protein DUF4242
MEIVVVERSFEQPLDINDMQATQKGFRWCLELHNVEFLHSYISSDRRRMICLYRAPDAESVRIVNATAKVQFDRVWSASLFAAPPPGEGGA